MNWYVEKKSFVYSLIVLGWLALFGLVILLAQVNWSRRNSITIFTSSGVFDLACIHEFERKTGIKVFINYANSNEELLVKLRSTKGSEYDLVVLSDYTVSKVIQLDMLKKLDKHRLPFFDTINPLLLGHTFDPENEYVIPFEWELYIIGFTKDGDIAPVISSTSAWDFVFKPKLFGKNYRFIMVNDPVEVIAMAAYHLFGDLAPLSDEQQEKVIELLKSQRPWIEAYSNVRTDYYLGTRNASVGLAQSAEIWRAARDYAGIEFIVPEKTFITIEHCALTAHTKKDDLVYQFLSFFYSKDVMKHHFEVFCYCPVRLDVITLLDAPERQKNIMRSSKQIFSNYLFIKDIVSEQRMHDIWVAVKSV